MTDRDVRPDDERRLREALRGAFERAPDLQARPEFADALREQLRKAPAPGRRWVRSHWLLALAASALLVAGLGGILVLRRSPAWTNALAQDAVGDHRDCALKFRLVRMPVPLEEAAKEFDSSYRLLQTAPADTVSTPDGEAHVKARHACVFGTRRFGHVVMEYRGHVVSLLMTANDGAVRAAQSLDVAPRLIGRPADGLSVVSVTGPHHAILLVSDLDSAELTRLSKAVSVPLAERLQARLPLAHEILATFFILPGTR
jgi:hypothetical protein